MTDRETLWQVTVWTGDIGPWHAWIYRLRQEAEEKGRELLGDLARDHEPVVATVLLSRNSGPRRPATESDPVYVIGRWNPDAGRIEDELGIPLDS